MPRQPRLDAPGLLHHIIARGIERRVIFKDDRDRESFIERLAEILEATQTQCYAWALIPNHFHLLLRTGLTPISTVMRRLMTGHAVYFNLRHNRSGHLFQNRYKSIICEDDPYLLELIRYIHLNPLRAGIVDSLNKLDWHRWCGHSTLVGRRKNPLIPTVVVNSETESSQEAADKKEKSLAEKTIEDTLLYFGSTFRHARQKYRQFVANGIPQGRRPELQGGGLINSAGGDKRLVGRKIEEREASDARILGSGSFVSATLEQSEKHLEKKYLPKRSIEDLIEDVAKQLDLPPQLICSGSRKKQIVAARALVSKLAVEETGHSAAEVAKYPGIGRTNVLRSLSKKRGL